jgi:class 3 adenylate cyclase
VGTANGGQVIASEDAVQAADVGGAVRFEPLGAFRVRDFEQPVKLAAVLGDVDSRMPSCRCAPSRRRATT